MGTLAGEILEKWVNGFWIKAYKGPMVANMFKIPEQYSDSHDVRTGATGDQPDVSTSGETRLPTKSQTILGQGTGKISRGWWNLRYPEPADRLRCMTGLWKCI